MNAVFKLIFRLLLLAVGLVFAASLLLVALLFLALWGLRAVWARLTGQPVLPFVWRVDPRTGFGAVFRARPGAAPAPQTAATTPLGRRLLPDIEDVDVKPPRD